MREIIFHYLFKLQRIILITKLFSNYRYLINEENEYRFFFINVFIVLSFSIAFIKIKTKRNSLNFIVDFEILSKFKKKEKKI